MNMKDYELIFGLAHASRRQIIEILRGGQMRHLELCKKLDISPPEVTRHCNILSNMGTIRKNSKSYYEITNMGQQLSLIVNNIEFLDSQREMFNEHDFSLIPEELSLMPVLEKSDIVQGPVNVLNGILSTNNSSLDYINCIFEETIDQLVLEQTQQLARGIRINILVKTGTRIPSEYMENRMLTLNIRQIDEIPLGMIHTDSVGFLIPKHKMGILDYGFGAQGNDETFMRFCDYLFNFYWERGRPVIL